MRVIFFGMAGQFSTIPFEQLQTIGIETCAVIVPATPSIAGSSPQRIKPPSVRTTNALNGLDLPMVEPYLNRNIISLAWRQGVPVWAVETLSDAPTLALLTNLQPDLIVVACFPYIFPQVLLDLPHYGCLNLHPSLLPAYRGPVPLFWIAHHDERITGVTLHFLTKRLDAGDIVAQTSFERADGLSEADLDRQCAEKGAKLLQQAIQQLEQGHLSRRAQVETEASYFSQPSVQDFIIPTNWPARRAFNFLRGASDWPLVIDGGDTHFCIRVAISYDIDHTLEHPYILLGDELWIQFQPGVLRTKIFAEL